MAEAGLYIVSGPVQSGKSTALLHWSENRKDVYGILTPIVDDQRVFMDACSREQFPMEAAVNEPAVLAVGRFRFSKNNFDRAIGIIRAAILQQGWLIIDEIGPLELRGEGFHDVLNEVLAQRKDKLLLVAREGLIEKIKEYFIPNAIVINAEDLFNLHQ